LPDPGDQDGTRTVFSFGTWMPPVRLPWMSKKIILEVEIRSFLGDGGL